MPLVALSAVTKAPNRLVFWRSHDCRLDLGNNMAPSGASNCHNENAPDGRRPGHIIDTGQSVYFF